MSKQTMQQSPDIVQGVETQSPSMHSLNIFPSLKQVNNADSSMRRPTFRGATGQQATLRKLRAILNKLTEDNIPKLGSQIVADFTLEQELTTKFVDLIFEKATASVQFTQVLAQLCSYLKAEYPQKTELGTLFGDAVAEKIRSAIETGYCDKFCSQIRFYGFLLNFQVIEQESLLESLNIMLQNPCDQSIEEVCHIFKTHGALIENQKLAEYQNILQTIKSREVCSHRIEIIAENTVELLQQLAQKKNEPSGVTNLPQFRCRTRVQFTTQEMCKSPSSPCIRSILRRTLKNDDKESIRNVVRGLRGENDIDSSIDAIKKLIDDNISQSSIVHYIIKHALLEQNEERWFKLLCNMISQAIELIKPQKLETGLTKAVKDMKEIQLDAPHAPRFIRVIVEELGNLNTLLEKQFLLYRIQMVS